MARRIFMLSLIASVAFSAPIRRPIVPGWVQDTLDSVERQALLLQNDDVSVRLNAERALAQMIDFAPTLEMRHGIIAHLGAQPARLDRRARVHIRLLVTSPRWPEQQGLVDLMRDISLYSEYLDSNLFLHRLAAEHHLGTLIKPNLFYLDRIEQILKADAADFTLEGRRRIENLIVGMRGSVE